jgi:hypothetical protein
MSNNGSISAGALRSRELKSRHRPEPPKPPRAFKVGDLVSTKVMRGGTTNSIVCGYEWGGNNREVMRNVWCYWTRPSVREHSQRWTLIPEDELERISP